MPLAQGLINGRYRPLRLVGEGGTGSVYLVRDTLLSDRPLALKLLRSDSVDPDSVERLKREFQSLARLRHPNLVEVFDFGSAAGDGRNFLTMEYLEGRDLAGFPWADLEDRFDTLVVQCLRALDYIHARGLLHNDIKPQNIVVLPPFRVKVLDFGLAQPLHDPATPGASGTLHYIAPERFQGRRPDPRSDLYALGVVLYGLAAGRLPFEGAEAGQVVGAILAGRPRPLAELNRGMPARQAEFVMALLAADPAARPASAAAALDLLNAGLAEPLALDTPETCASFVASGRFVARDGDLQALLDLVRARAAGPGRDGDRPRLALVSGPPGIGKSRLLRELKHRLQLEGIPNFTGRCYETGGVPLQPVAEVLRQLPRGAAFPAALRPVVDQVAGAAAVPGSEGPKESGGAAHETTPAAPRARADRAEFIADLAGALDALAGGTAGVLFLDDLHWGDAPTIDLLEHLLLRDRPAPWVLIGSLRDLEGRAAPVGRLLERYSEDARLRYLTLRPLDAEQVADLVASMLPFVERPSALARALVEQTQGNPLHLEELMQSLAQEGGVSRRGGAWIAGPESIDILARAPSTVASLVTRRLALLEPDRRALLEMLAVFNRPVPVPLLLAALGWEPARAADAVADLEGLRLADRETQPDATILVSLPHSRIRDAIYETVPPDRRPAAHLAAARAIEAVHQDFADQAVEDLAHHYLIAGDRERAIEYALRAADRAEELYNDLREVHFREQALSLLPVGDARRLEQLRSLGESLVYFVGDYHLGSHYSRMLQEESRSAGQAVVEAAALTLLGRAATHLGDLQGGVDLGQQAVAHARRTGDTAAIANSINTFGISLGRQSKFREALTCFDESRGLFASIGRTDKVDLVDGNIAMVNIYLGNVEAGLGIMKRLMEQMPSDRRYLRARTLANLAYFTIQGGDLRGALPMLQESLRQARELTSLDIVGHACTTLGLALPLDGRFARATEALNEGLALRRRLNDQPEQSFILDLLGNAARLAGRLDEAERHHHEGLTLARTLSSRVQEGYLLAGLAADRLERGVSDEARDLAKEALAIADDLGHGRIAFLARSVLALDVAGRRDRKEINRLARALQRRGSHGFYFPDRPRINLVLGRCALAAGRPADALREGRAGLGLAEKAGARELIWRFHALVGDALAAKNLADEARSAYNAALSVIREVASEIEDPAMRKDYLEDEQKRAVARAVEGPSVSAGKAAETAGPGAAPDPASGAPAAGFPVGPPFPPAASGSHRGDPVRMLTTLYDITQIITSILDLKTLLEKVMDLAIEIVGAERGLIFLYRSDTDEMEMVVARNMERQTIKDATAYSRSILREAGRGRPILSHDALTDARFKQYKSVATYAIHSLLCVPLRYHDRILGTVYVDTRLPGAVFTESELRFLEAFANQAAIAIENARAHDRMQEENLNLRRAVQERYGYESIVGRSPGMRAVFTLLKRIAPSALPVLILGESGTGKELVARAIHQNGPRRERKFYGENCAALPETLLESELFGHVRGAFTGADASRRGLFELADGGTLFLDEVGDMSMALQSKLLRVLQDGEIRPVGAEATRRVDVRIISATNRNLEALIREKKFRQDLLFRLNVITVALPPLRDRREDIALLVDHFLARIARDNHTRKLRVDPALAAALARYDWPGNVRELENQIYRLALFAAGDTLTLHDAGKDPEFLKKVPTTGMRGVDTGVTRKEIESALTQTAGHRVRAAGLLGISRATMFRKLKEYRIDKTRRRAMRRHPHH